MQAFFEWLILHDLKHEGKLRHMNGLQFFQTKMGHKFYEHDVPRIADSLACIAKELKNATEHKEQQQQDLNEGETAYLKEKIISIANYVREINESWEMSYKKQGAVPYPDAKSVMSVLTRLLRKP